MTKTTTHLTRTSARASVIMTGSDRSRLDAEGPAKVWQLGSNQPNFTLEGHEKGVNCVDYYHGGDKPYIISGADDRLVKIWDYQNKTCVQSLDGHAQNISAGKPTNTVSLSRD